MTQSILQLKTIVKKLPCLGIPDPTAKLIVETDASDLDDLFSKKFLLKTDCKAATSVLQKDVKNLVSKHIFARWQSLLSCFDFEIEHIQGIKNSLPDFLTREFLQGKHE
ncbi:unnamed protein product [Trifolium pratense]|uniref:Uncharacterized protein n=2 Tax=Trifolium pratense TaxID=57577 RepID=A0ACB0K8E6_TRIPR|nr:unnamed protein product [Trifolium pratense]CAJ2653135.1 unnamed protein product [Trifolium pratense]